MCYLKPNRVYLGNSVNKMLEIEPDVLALSFWSPPYFVGKDYEKSETYESWQELLKTVIENHSLVLKPGGFLVINTADILCFKDEGLPKIQSLNLSNQKCPISRDEVLEAKSRYPEYN